MNTSPEVEKLLQDAVQVASETTTPPPGPHPVDEEDLLLDWCEGELPPDALEALLEHLANCPPCRREVAAMIRAGALPLPGLELEEPVLEETATETSAANADAVPAPPASPSAARPRTRSATPWLPLVVAASILALLAGLWWSRPTPGTDVLLARAERELGAGHPHEALVLVEGLWDEGLRGEHRRQAAQLLSEAGYTAARSELAQGEFAAVLETEDRVARRAGRTAGLANLRLQAQRGMPASVALSQAGRLTDYGYELDGSAPRKSLPILDETVERLDAEFRAALAEFPHDPALLLNRGQFLLELSRYAEAAELFEQVLALQPPADAPSRRWAHLGLGLSHFERGEYAPALEHFRQAGPLGPPDDMLEVNTGIALVQLGRREEARSHFQWARELTDDPLLEQRIDAYLDEDTE